MADAAEEDVDLDVGGTRVAPLERERRQGSGGRLGGVAFAG
jgi:hypothetical protein